MDPGGAQSWLLGPFSQAAAPILAGEVASFQEPNMAKKKGKGKKGC